MKEGNDFGIYSIICGILCIPSAFVIFMFGSGRFQFVFALLIGLIITIFGIVFAVMQKRKLKTRLATIGLIINITSAILFLIILTALIYLAISLRHGILRFL